MSYTFEQFNTDIQSFITDSKDFFTAQIAWGLEQLQSTQNITTEFRQSVQRQITEAQLDWLTSQSAKYAQMAGQVGD